MQAVFPLTRKEPPAGHRGKYPCVFFPFPSLRVTRPGSDRFLGCTFWELQKNNAPRKRFLGWNFGNFKKENAPRETLPSDTSGHDSPRQGGAHHRRQQRPGPGEREALECKAGGRGGGGGGGFAGPSFDFLWKASYYLAQENMFTHTCCTYIYVHIYIHTKMCAFLFLMMLFFWRLPKIPIIPLRCRQSPHPQVSHEVRLPRDLGGAEP